MNIKQKGKLFIYKVCWFTDNLANISDCKMLQGYKYVLDSLVFLIEWNDNIAFRNRSQ